jgi:hypothetical protein
VCAQGRKAGRSAGDARGQIRVHHQPPDGKTLGIAIPPGLLAIAVEVFE